MLTCPFTLLSSPPAPNLHSRKGEGGRGEENEKWREGGFCVWKATCTCTCTYVHCGGRGYGGERVEERKNEEWVGRILLL